MSFHIMTARGWRVLQTRSNSVRPAPHDVTLLEQLGLNEFNTSAQYCGAIKRYMNSEISHDEMKRITSLKLVEGTTFNRPPAETTFPWDAKHDHRV